MKKRAYYEAYDERYKTVHARSIRWFGDLPSPIVEKVISRYGIEKTDKILEIGCGEGRDALPLLNAGYDLLATDVSPEAIAYCQALTECHKDRFCKLDCVKDSLPQRFDLILAVAVLHMLVPDADRTAFYRFLRAHLTSDGVALICTMGDGETDRQSDVRTAFELQAREYAGETIPMAGTSCRMVSFATLARELAENGLLIREQGFTEIPENFPSIMYAVVSQKRN